jgi:membrane protein implicated in regulation of membrane protease activity
VVLGNCLLEALLVLLKTYQYCVVVVVAVAVAVVLVLRRGKQFKANRTRNEQNQGEQLHEKEASSLPRGAIMG